MIDYAKRENVFEKAERRWIVDADGLHHLYPGRPEAVLPWNAVREIRLTFAPTRMKAWRHKLTLRTGAATWIIDNGHYRGVGDFEDRSDRFSPFVLACVERVREAAPGATARLGSAPLAYWAQLIFVTAMFGLLALVLIALPTTWSAFVWIKFALILAMLPVLFSWVIRSWPRKVALDPGAFRTALP